MQMWAGLGGPTWGKTCLSVPNSCFAACAPCLFKLPDPSFPIVKNKSNTKAGSGVYRSVFLCPVYFCSLGTWGIWGFLRTWDQACHCSGQGQD